MASVDRFGFSPEKKAMIGKRIRNLRETKHESESELAVGLDVSRAAVCQWERGKTAPSPRNLRALAEHFGVSYEYLLKGNPDEPESQQKPQESTDDTLFEKYPGLIAGLNAFAEAIEKL